MRVVPVIENYSRHNKTKQRIMADDTLILGKILLTTVETREARENRPPN